MMQPAQTQGHPLQVLEDLVEEDDSNPHTWHLLGTAYYAGGMLEEAREVCAVP